MLSQNAFQHHVAAGTLLFEQGEVPRFQHAVLSGSIHLYGCAVDGREVLIETVSAPDLVIPAAVVTGSAYLMKAKAPVPSRVLLIQADAFRAAVASDLAFAQATIASLAGQFRRMVRQIKNLKLRTASQRVGCYILGLSQRQGTPDRATLPYGKHLIASELGITRESFSRALAQLQGTSIRVADETVFILDAARLAADSLPDPLIDGIESGAGLTPPPLPEHLPQVQR